MVRTRFAPSPTGYLHVGGLRTALFSFLYARQQQGSFLFRLEDTDRNRLVEGAEEDLIAMLKWAGITPDEGPGVGGDYGPYKQSERLEIYARHAQILLDKGHAYPCFCSAERLEQVKTEQKAQGLISRYDGHCRNLPRGEGLTRMESGEPYVIRMKIPENETILMEDLIRDKVAISSEQLDDQVLIKTDRFPTYHMAVVVDDHLMRITHVIRGEEWLPSFPKHLLLYRYFGWEPPKFAHLPLILNTDRSKLSKRQGSVSVEDFRKEGYLSQTMVNFIALLGWNPGDAQELFSMEQLIERFSFERVGKSGSVFDREKLNWMNQQYIKKLSPAELWDALVPYIQTTPFAGESPDRLKKVCQISQNSLTQLKDIQNSLSLFFEDRGSTLSDPILIEFLKKEESRVVLKAFLEQTDTLETLED
ncbi:MAG: glutamate--tRNA ligase, partial [SAR324 cluster bacterium]|nr:glutamate--tRNA ligase [SAR324 cluster bacterium]